MVKSVLLPDYATINLVNAFFLIIMLNFAIALFVIMKAGDKVDMSGEKHGGDTTTHAPEPAPAK